MRPNQQILGGIYKIGGCIYIMQHMKTYKGAITTNLDVIAFYCAKKYFSL